MRIEKVNKLIEDGYLDEARQGLKEYYLALDYADWKKTRQVEYDVLFKTKEVVIEATEEVEASSHFDYIDDCISFNDWLNETKTVLIGTETREDDNGVTYEKEIFEEQLIRVYTPTNVTTLVNDYLKPYIDNLSKEEQLKNLEITEISNGLQFYTDDKSLLDLMSADREAEKLGATDADSTLWKTVDGIKQVTIADIRKAISTRLSNKAKIVGVS